MQLIKTVSIRIALVVLALYSLFLCVLYLNQRILIFPGLTTQGTAGGSIQPLDHDGTLVWLRTSTNVPIASYLASPLPLVIPTGKTVLFFYGNGCCLNSCWYILDHFRSLGCSVMMVDYPGYGMSRGVATEDGCYDAAEAAYKYLTTVRRTQGNHIVVAGWSLGSAVAIHLAAHEPVAGLIAFSAFTNMKAMANHEYSIVPEVVCALLLKYRFPSVNTMEHVRCPTFLAQGALDTFVPPIMLGKLAAADHGVVTRVIVPGVGHNDILSDGGPALYSRLRLWILSLPDNP